MAEKSMQRQLKAIYNAGEKGYIKLMGEYDDSTVHTTLKSRPERTWHCTKKCLPEQHLRPFAQSLISMSFRCFRSIILAPDRTPPLTSWDV
jgi:hypothetical protein